MAGALLSALALLVLSAGAAHAATIVVNSTADTVAVDSLCTLREAIINANNDAATYPDCTAGSGADTITFSVNGIITLGSALPDVTSALTISGNGTADTVIQANASANVATYGLILVTTANGDLTLRNVTLRHGGSAAASVDGGCVSATTGGKLTLADSIVESCYGRFGGGVSASSASLTLTNTLVQNNFATVDGGGIDTLSSAVTITHSTITNNRNINPSSNGAGGGITTLDNSRFTMTGSVVSNNTLTGTLGGIGGGLYVSGFSGGAVVIISSVITGNSASPNNAGTDGGGVYYAGSDPLTIINTVVANNTASDKGGGIYDAATGTLALANVTVSGNSAPGGGGGLYRTAAGGIANLQNALLAGNAGGDCTRLAGGTVNAQHSLIQNALTCINGTNTNNLSGDPALNADLTLLSTSRAINAGDNALVPGGVATDLAGNARIQQSTVDMGAYESPFATPTAATVGDFVATGQADRVQITWQTLNEIGLYGFHLYRGLDPAGPGDRITGDPVAAQGAGGLEGFAYSYDDFTPLPAETSVYYWLEELHSDRGPIRHGPQQVAAADNLRVFLPLLAR
jgi:CSLREA domain-containing protein